MKSKNSVHDVTYPKAPNLDDQIIAKEDVAFDIFLFSERFLHWELSERRPSARIDSSLFELRDGVLLCNGKRWDAAAGPLQEGFENLVVREHHGLETLTTTLPRQDFTISSHDCSAVSVSSDAAAVVSVAYDDGARAHSYALRLEVGNSPVYWNGKKTTRLETSFDVADVLVIGGVALERRPRQLKITLIDGSCRLDPWALVAEEFQPEYPADFPEYRRSPRIILQKPTDKVKVNAPEAAPKESKNDIVRTILPPIVMLSGGFAMVTISGGNPLMMLGMAGASVATAGMSVSSYIANKKEHRATVKANEDKYRQLLVRKTAELKTLASKQRHCLEFHYPDPSVLADMVCSYHPRIYERSSNNADFLSFSLGKGPVAASYGIDFESEAQGPDALMGTARELVDSFRALEQAPITTTLQGQTLGLTGTYPVLKNAVSGFLFQIAVFQSYRDVEFIVLVPEETYEQDWKQWRWLPHLRISAINMRGIVHDAQSRDLVLNSFYQIMAKRRQALKEAGREKISFRPHYVLTVLDDSHLAGHGLNEFLAEDMSQYGVTVIWGKEARSMLPETITTLVQYGSSEAGELINENRVYVAKKFTPLRTPEKHALESAIGRLANLHHVEVEKNAIPQSVTFLDMYGVKKIEQLGVLQRWSGADTSKTLSVPLGLRGKEDVVFLNLHERAHGPHGLVAGTTGSGKSEILQSYVLSLAINFAPEDVGFLPIDFKGGGMANEFKGLPHLLGSITNLDGAGSARALASIRAELQKRQRFFGQFGVNHINGYTKLYKQGKTVADPDGKARYPQEPLPHLFLISDEFAELKANEPEFMAELVSTARIGRSLGVHLILATQKPSGVVDDQIWSNSRFKLALKVQDESDSNEILKTPDAAAIVEPGRAYLQVGNNEIYELFQSAWSGALYDPDAVHEEAADERIWLINELGQQQLLTRDLSGGQEDKPHGPAAEEPVTQLAGVVAHIARVAEESGVVLPQKPWLPPLPEDLAVPEVDWRECWRQPRELAVPLGMLDIPLRQAQEPLMFDVARFGHTAVHGSAGFGKSTVLQTLVMGLARRNTPEQVTFNLLDFGTNGLLPLKDLPHVADLARLEDREKLVKFLKRIRGEVGARKELFAEAGVASLAQYESKTGQRLCVAVTVVDGYDPVREHGMQDEIESVVNQILRDGAAVGMYVVLTGLRSDTFKIGMVSNIPTRMALFLVEENAAREVVGREAAAAQEIAGRGQIKLDEPTVVQFYLPVDADGDVERLKELESEIAQMDRYWEGDRPEPIPMVSTEFDVEDFNSNENVVRWQATGNIPLASALKDTRPLGFLVEKHPFFAMAYTAEEQLRNQQLLLASQLERQAGRYRLYMADFESEYSGFHDIFNEAYAGEGRVAAAMELLSSYMEAAKKGQKKKAAIFYVSNVEDFLVKTGITDADMRYVLSKGYRAGLHIILHGLENYLGKSFATGAQNIRALLKAGIVSARVSDTGLISNVGSSVEPQLRDNEAYYFEAQGRRYEKVRIAGPR